MVPNIMQSQWHHVWRKRSMAIMCTSFWRPKSHHCKRHMVPVMFHVWKRSKQIQSQTWTVLFRLIGSLGNISSLFSWQISHKLKPTLNQLCFQVGTCKQNNLSHLNSAGRNSILPIMHHSHLLKTNRKMVAVWSHTVLVLHPFPSFPFKHSSSG